ncbi:MAG: PHP domain-containing protein [Gammaproteobacteria bacterium]|jgi:hypothetical protein|nr:PHP domain-containing protein [Gammaproteobacteria bacterium]
MSFSAFDLHSHSTASDGTLEPSDLVARAHAAGVPTLALTDHDTTAGLAAAKAEADRLGLDLVAGVEVSVTWDRRTVHVVGLHVEPAHAQLEAGLARLRAFRDWRAEEIGRRLERHGIPGTLDGARRLTRGTIVSRTHFARHLVERGAARDLREVFRHFLVSGKPGHVPGQWAGLEEAVGWIRAAGGQAVLAHPARYALSGTRLRGLLGEFREVGGAAVEVVSGSHSRDDCLVMAAESRSAGLLASAGSDYHGPESPWLELGRLPELPPGCTAIWDTWSH